METASVVATSTWLPEDDLLLKNAVEDGASLEALAKGAVPFSCAFTLQQLQDRWHALLYNSDVSAQVSAHLFLDESDKAKEVKMFHRKRKVGSIRKRYYAQLKRIRSELFSSADLGFLPEPNLHPCTGNGSDFHEHVLHDGPPVGNTMLGDCMPDHFGLREEDFDILHHAFPQAMTDLTAPNAVANVEDAFHSEGPDSLADNQIRKTAKNDCSRGFPEADSSFSGQGSLRNDGMASSHPNNECKDIPHSLQANSTGNGKCLVSEKMDLSQPLPGGELSGTNDSETKALSTFHSTSSNLQHISSEFEESHQFISPNSDGSASLHTMGFSPPLPSMPLWETMEDIAAPAMLMNASPDDKMQDAQDVSELPGNDDSKSKRYSGQGAAHLRAMLSDKQNGDSFINSTPISDGEFVDIPDSLFDFPSDEIIFMDVDGRVTMDKSCCGNTLSGFPMDVNDDDTLKVGAKAIHVSNAAVATGGVSCAGEPEVVTSHLHAVLGQEKTGSHLKIQMSATSTLNNKSLERSEGKLYCTLNTEDPEIPCNDDIFLLIHPAAPFPSAVTSITKSAVDPVSVNERNSVQGLNLVKKREEHAESSKPSSMFGSYMLPETSQVHVIAGCTVKSELADTCCKDLAPRHKAVTDLTQCKSAQTSLSSAAEGKLETGVKKVDTVAVDTPGTFRESPLHPEAGRVEITLPEPAVNPSTSDQEECESDYDDPHFSDIEAMILEMDLGSYDEDLYYSRRVLRYQHEISKRTIIRLEQCARSSIQRAMTSQSALAVLYGRRSRHFIRKTEVILGRSTEETDVDIDLGKEGRPNKISRRQAIVKMEDNGSFSLKNLAKNPMLVNGTEVGTGELLGLSPSSLIEIRGVSFVFESNQKSVRRYLESIAKQNQGQMANFKWSTKEEP